MSPLHINLTRSNAVATIILSRPDAANSINLALAQELLAAALECNDPGVRAVLITSVGQVFSSGGDLKEFDAQGEQLAAHLRETADVVHEATLALTRLNAPVIAAVNGVAAGAGMSLACSCDLVLAAESARFTMAYTRVGLSPDGSGTWFIPRIIGPRRAMELALTNRVLNAAEALDWGLVTRVVPDDQLMPEARTLAEQLAEGPTLAYASAKRLLLGSWMQSLEAQLEQETQSIAALGATHDGREGIRAFLEKRVPRFENR